IFESQRNSLLSTGFLVGVLVLNAVLCVWRAAAIAHAGLLPPEAVVGAQRRTAVAAVGVLLVATLAMHAWIGSVVGQLESTLTQVFAGADPDDAAPPATPGTGGADDPPASVAPEYRRDGNERL